MTEDIRDKPHVDHDDVIGLNFIRSDGPFFFRRHHRNGLRSHVLEVLAKADVRRETDGEIRDGVRWFPRARPLKMLRLFRRRFSGFEAVAAETRRVKFVERYLSAAHMARSAEFVVEYHVGGGRQIMLCGLQEHVQGLQLDPWQQLGVAELASVVHLSAGGVHNPPDALGARIRYSAAAFIHSVQRMIRETGHVPDLAGDGNLLLTPDGGIKLVDINNISPVSVSAAIYADDIGYPVCDKSIEALSLLEQHLLDRPPDMTDPVYRHFLDPDRRRRVAELDRAFHRTVNPAAS